jgi:hypothetical protein
VRPPELPREVTYSVAEHQMLLSFNNDSDTEVFDRWWHLEGRDAFLEFAQKEGA